MQLMMVVISASVGAVCGLTVVEQFVQQGTDHTSLGALMPSVSVDDMTCPILTTCGLSDRKSRTQQHKETLMRRFRASISLDGTVVLKGEL